MATYLFADTGALYALGKAGLLDTLLPPFNGGRELVITREVRDEVNNASGYPLGQEVLNWLDVNKALYTETRNKVITNPDNVADRSIGYYASGLPDGGDANAFKVPLFSDVLVLHEDPSGMRAFVEGSLTYAAPSPMTSTGWVSDRVLSGDLKYADAVKGWNEVVTGAFVQLNDPTTTDPHGVNIFGAKAIGNPSPSGDRQIGEATIPLMAGTVSTGSSLTFPGSADSDIIYNNPFLKDKDWTVSWSPTASVEIDPATGAVAVSGQHFFNQTPVAGPSDTTLYFPSGSVVVVPRDGTPSIKLNSIDDSSIQHASLHVDENDTTFVGTSADGQVREALAYADDQELKVKTDQNGAISDFFYQRGPISVDLGSIGATLGSEIGSILGHNSVVERIAAGTLIGTLGQELGKLLQFGSIVSPLTAYSWNDATATRSGTEFDNAETAAARDLRADFTGALSGQISGLLMGGTRPATAADFAIDEAGYA